MPSSFQQQMLYSPTENSSEFHHLYTAPYVAANAPLLAGSCWGRRASSMRIVARAAWPKNPVPPSTTSSGTSGGNNRTSPGHCCKGLLLRHQEDFISHDLIRHSNPGKERQQQKKTIAIAKHAGRKEGCSHNVKHCLACGASSTSLSSSRVKRAAT